MMMSYNNERNLTSRQDTFKETTIERNFFLSPMTMQLETATMAAFISFSIRTGGMFSPPAVIINSLIRPVI
jgi:hypothetical protein